MEAPRGVQVSAAAGDFKATCRKELHLQSTEGEVSSDLSRSIMPDSCNPMDCSPPGSSVHEDSSGRSTGVELPCPPPGHLPNPGTKPRSPALQEASLPAKPPGKPLVCHILGLPVF